MALYTGEKDWQWDKWKFDLIPDSTAVALHRDVPREPIGKVSKALASTEDANTAEQHNVRVPVRSINSFSASRSERAVRGRGGWGLRG